MINEKIRDEVTTLCRKYSKPPIRNNSEVILSKHDQSESQVSVIAAMHEITTLRNKLVLSADKVYPQLSAYLSKLGQVDIKVIERKDFVKMLVDGLPALSDAYEEHRFTLEYKKELADHMDFSKVMAREFEA